MKKALGSKVVDIYGLARLPQGVSVEEAFTTLAALKSERLFGHVAASELKAESLFDPGAESMSLSARLR